MLPIPLKSISRLCALVLIALAGCESAGKRTAEITVRNDIQDSTFNVVVVDQIESESGGGRRVSLRPGEEAPLTGKGIRAMRFSRRYEEFTRVYLVRCPATREKRLLLKLIDVHLNKLPGGCELTKRGKSADGFTTWEPQ